MVDLGIVRRGSGDSLPLREVLQSAVEEHAFVAVLRAEDEIFDGAIDKARAILSRNPHMHVLYGDEVRSTGEQDTPFYKPAWSPQRLRWQHLLSGLTIYSRAAIERAVPLLGNARSSMAELHDLALVVSEGDPLVGHAPIPFARVGGEGAGLALDPAVLDRHLRRVGLPMEARPHPAGDHLLSFEPDFSREPFVSVVVPTGGAQRLVAGRLIDLVDNAVCSLVEHTAHQAYEIVVVLDQHSSPSLGDRLTALSPARVRIVRDDRPFNFAAATNLGVEHAKGDIILLLNDDTQIVEPDWMGRLVAHTCDDGVGAVGARLLYGDRRLQHAGVTMRNGQAAHAYRGWSASCSGHGDELTLPINTRSATGACLMVRADHWRSVGGMTETFPLNYNDVDLCLKLAQQGWRTLVDNTTNVVHLETSSRPSGSEPWEDDAFDGAWPGFGHSDPYDSPNFVPMAGEHVPKPVPLVQLAELRNGPQPVRWSTDW